MIRRKHDLRKKTHVPFEIQYRGKPDSALVVCSCGYVDLVATWYTGRAMHQKTGVRTEHQWNSIMMAVELFLEAATFAREGK